MQFTNSHMVDAMPPTTAKHADIWTLELVIIQAFHLQPEKKSKSKTTIAVKDHMLFCDHSFNIRH